MSTRSQLFFGALGAVGLSCLGVAALPYVLYRAWRQQSPRDPDEKLRAVAHDVAVGCRRWAYYNGHMPRGVILTAFAQKLEDALGDKT